MSSSSPAPTPSKEGAFAPEPPRLKAAVAFKSIVSYLIAQWIVFGLGLAILVAWAAPSVGKNGGAIRAEYTVKWGAIALIFLLTGLSLSTKSFLNQALNWHLHLVTQFISFFVFPAVVYAIVWAVVGSNNSDLDKTVLGGIITMGVLPTTLYVHCTIDEKSLLHQNTVQATLQ
jgi:solute carrier family 10 (sodium/bile acid cotransporter), member 7